MSLISKSFLVYESMKQQKYFPGELIMSIDKRSVLADDYKEFYTRRYSYLHAEIAARKRMIEEGINRPKKKKQVLVFDEVANDED